MSEPGRRAARAVRGKRSGALFALALALVSPPETAADDRTCLALAPTEPQAPSSWMGESRVWAGHIPGRTGACLGAQLFAPPEGAFEGPRPAVVVVGGTGAPQASQWAGRYLASRGYVVLGVSPQGHTRSEVVSPEPCDPVVDPFASLTTWCRGYPPILNLDNFSDAIRSGIDHLLSPENPFPVLADAIGAAGHSQGARGACLAQEEDPRIRAIVAWDNLTLDKSGDAGLATGGGPAGALIAGQIPGSSFPIEPRVPAMGHASDGKGLSNVDPGPDVKKIAYEKWRAAGLPAFELVLRDAAHEAWSADIAEEGSLDDFNHQVILYYTHAWFDRYLLDRLPAGHPEPKDVTAHARALDRLTSAGIQGVGPLSDGTARNDILSRDWHSAMFFPEAGMDCPDLLAGCE
ncbi:MAG: alpha/beta hydrolase family protein [Candidatus Binatia bacterium]